MVIYVPKLVGDITYSFVSICKFGQHLKLSHIVIPNSLIYLRAPPSTNISAWSSFLIGSTIHIDRSSLVDHRGHGGIFKLPAPNKMITTFRYTQTHSSSPTKILLASFYIFLRLYHQQPNHLPHVPRWDDSKLSKWH